MRICVDVIWSFLLNVSKFKFTCGIAAKQPRGPLGRSKVMKDGGETEENGSSLPSNLPWVKTKVPINRKNYLPRIRIWRCYRQGTLTQKAWKATLQFPCKVSQSRCYTRGEIKVPILKVGIRGDKKCPPSDDDWQGQITGEKDNVSTRRHLLFWKIGRMTEFPTYTNT